MSQETYLKEEARQVGVAKPRQFPLSFAQQRLWFLDQLEPNSPLYNVPISLRLEGPLDVTALERSLNEIVRRHEALRTAFPTLGDQPCQMISAAPSLSLPVIDLTGRPASERENEAQRLAKQEAERPFDLARGPLVRVALLRLNDGDHVLLLTLHHIVSDAWSIGVLYRELSALYGAFSKGLSSPLPEPPIQYIDFTRRQRDALRGEVYEEQLSYWKKQLQDLPILQLPTDRPRPPIQTFHGATVAIVLPQELTEDIKRLSRQARASLFMTLLAVFKVLLYRYTGQEDIVVGSPIANRGRVEFEGLIGFLLNTLALRTDLSGNPSFLELLGRLREIAFEAYANQDIPFEKLVEELRPERLLNQNPLFQVLFVLQNDALTDLNLSGVRSSLFTTENNTAKFDLSLFIADSEQGLIAKAQYNTDLFGAETMQRMLEHFRNLLEGIVDNPRRSISELPLLANSERRRLLVEWNETSAQYPRHASIIDLVDAQVERTPEAIAVLFPSASSGQPSAGSGQAENRQLTYRELNERTNRLASSLQSLGVGPGAQVAICMERSPEMVIAVLATLKAGGAYVPLDPTFPKERLAFMIEDSRASVLLTQTTLLAKLPNMTDDRRPTTDTDATAAFSSPSAVGGPRPCAPSALRPPAIVCLDTDWETTDDFTRAIHDSQAAIRNPPSTVGGPRPSPEDLAYVIYTSGSTGKPKAVAMVHGALCNLIAWQLRNLKQPVPARTLQFASLSFDVSFQEMFTTLCSGVRSF